MLGGVPRGCPRRRVEQGEARGGGSRHTRRGTRGEGQARHKGRRVGQGKGRRVRQGKGRRVGQGKGRRVRQGKGAGRGVTSETATA